MIVQTDEVFIRANLVFLMAVAALPFPSAVMGRYGSQRAAVILYAAALAVTAALTTILWLVAARRHLLAPTVTPLAIRDGVMRGGTAAILFALSIPVAAAAPHAAPYIWFSFLLARLILRRTGIVRGL